MYLLTAFDGKYIIPIGLIIAAIYSAYRGYRSSHSGSYVKNPDGSSSPSDTNVSYLKTGGGAFSIILALAAIATFILMRSER